METVGPSRCRLFGMSVLATIALLGSYVYLSAGPGSSVALSATPTGGAPPLTKMQAPKNREVATFAAGCFWSMEAIFKQLKGVEKVEPGYAGGNKANPSYEEVETGQTGFAETANITFDPKVITYRDLLTVLLTVRNPTTLNKQGPDEGPQYRSVIFYHNPQQKKAAQDTIAKFTSSHVWKDPIVTKVTPFTNFYRAEDYHLDYYNRHPNEPYCQFVVAPEIKEFREKFASKLKK
jgi:peptide-methionine (S)-S-oxide reductase